MSEGWISVHRNLLNHYLWQDKPFSKGQAWIDLLMLVNHSDNKIMLGNELINVERGSHITSEIKLMERWGWSKSKVRGFLKVLENDSMIVKKTDQKKTTLTICNYNVWQDNKTTEEPQKDHEKTSKRPQKDTNNNDNNVNNEKENILCDFFESIWKLYPEKKGKSKVSKKSIKELEKLGYEKVKEIIETYTKKKPSWKNYQNGSTFFNGGYLDYIDVEEAKHEEPKKEIKPIQIVFNRTI